MANNQSVPTGAKVISVLYYIGAGFEVLFGLAFLVGAGVLGAIIAQIIPALGMIGAGFFAVVGVLFIGVGILSFFVGRGLWKAKNWARIVAIVLTLLGIIGEVFSLFSEITFSAILMLAVNLFIAGYLLFSPSVKEAFA
ncbi:MAG: DUF2127 domain-containing protein [Nanoarchaeota archaeon]|nr:DUF2127 domain-containing protein [Nanoarchaeota archaeon]